MARIHGYMEYPDGLTPGNAQDGGWSSLAFDDDGRLRTHGTFHPSSDDDDDAWDDDDDDDDDDSSDSESDDGSVLADVILAAGTLTAVMAGVSLKRWWDKRSTQNQVQAAAVPQPIESSASIRAAAAAEAQVRIAWESAAQARRAQFALWRQTPDGLAYQAWLNSAQELAFGYMREVAEAHAFQEQVAAAHAHDVMRARSLFPDPRPVAIPIAPSERSSQVVWKVAESVPVAGEWVHQLHEYRDKGLAKKHAIATEKRKQWEHTAAGAQAARREYLRGASEDPNNCPHWWDATVIVGGYIPDQQNLARIEDWAMTNFPAPHQLPALARVSFWIYDQVPGGPEVQEALAQYRGRHARSVVHARPQVPQLEAPGAGEGPEHH